MTADACTQDPISVKDCRWEQVSPFITETLKEIRQDQKEMLKKVSALEVKAGVWGLMGGLIPVIILLAVFFIRAQLQDIRLETAHERPDIPAQTSGN